MISVFAPSLYGKPNRLMQTLHSHWWGTGQAVADAEAAFANWVGVQHDRCLMLNSCTSALHLAVKLFPESKRFFLPSITFVSTGLAPRYEGKLIEFVEVGDDLCIDQDDVLARLHNEKDVVIAVHMGGHAADLSKLQGHCNIIEDCAHALGTYDHGRHVGSQNVSCFSFQATKTLPIGDGGMLVLSEEEQRERAAAMSWCGIRETTWERTGGQYRWQYDIESIGYKYRANDLMASLMLDQWDGFPMVLAIRDEIAVRYGEALEDLDWLTLPRVRPGTMCNWQEYIIRTPYRDALQEHLKAEGIATTVHYYPIHLYLPFHQIDEGIVIPQKLPRTEAIWKELLTIPCHPMLSEEDQERVIDVIRTFPH